MKIAGNFLESVKQSDIGNNVVAINNGNGMVKSYRIGQPNAAKSPKYKKERRSTTIIRRKYIWIIPIER